MVLARLVGQSFISPKKSHHSLTSASNPPPSSALIDLSLHGGCTAKEPERPGSLPLTGSLHWSVCRPDTSARIWLLSARHFRGRADAQTHAEWGKAAAEHAHEGMNVPPSPPFGSQPQTYFRKARRRVSDNRGPGTVNLNVLNESYLLLASVRCQLA